MKTTLTLTVDPNLLASVKQLAKSRNTSLSELVERHVEELLKIRQSKRVDVTEKYIRAFADSEKSYNELKAEYLLEKYGE